MSNKKGYTIAALLAALSLAAVPALKAGPSSDFGVFVQNKLEQQANGLVGFGDPLSAPADLGDYVPRQIANAMERQLLAKGLKAEFVTRSVAEDADMIAFWPDDINYTHLIICIEQSRATGGTNPSVQRVNVNTGAVQTILYGMSRCDGIRTTPWATILATEEEDDGRAYEIFDPTTTTGQWVEDRGAGLIRTALNGSTTSTNIFQRQALPTMAWEGLTVLANGVVIGGDELRPGDATGDADGGSIFRFVPDSQFECSGPLNTPGAVCSNPLPTNMAGDSPLASGHTFAMQVQCVTGTQFGQGCEIGNASWIEVDPLTARSDADAQGATGYYRPEDLDRDPNFGPADRSDLSEGIRFCWTNTGNEGASNFAETVCAIDTEPDAYMIWNTTVGGINNDYLSTDGNSSGRVKTIVNRFVEGDERFNSFDNLAFQPGTGNLYVIEDHDFGEVFGCLRDGADRDIKTDGCLSMLSVTDPEAEPTGFIFDGTGNVAYYNVQHGEHPGLAGFTDTDDLIKITGFKNPLPGN